MENKEFYRRTVKVGNSAGVLLPKSLLGAEVKVSVINMPHNLKKDALRILEPILENIIGIYIIQIIYILTNTLVTIDSGEDKLEKIYYAGKN